MALEAGKQIAIGCMEGVKLLEALGVPRELAGRFTRFEIVVDGPLNPIRLNVTFPLIDNDIPAIGSALVGYQLVRSED